MLSCAAEASEILALLVMLLEQCHRRYYPRHAQPGHLRHRNGTKCQAAPLACLAVSKRSATIVILAAVAVGIVLGIVWHEPKGMSLPDDIRTWAGFVVVIVGAGAALWQLDMQRRQLAEQKDVLKDEVERNKKRDALIAGQLLELEQRALTYERLQAEEIDVRWSSIRRAAPGSSKDATRMVHMAEVVNSSRRPIRNVACRIEPEPGGSMQAAVQVGSGHAIGPAIAVAGSVGPRKFLNLSDGSHILLMRTGEEVSFVFETGIEEYPKAQVTARFTDDAGLHWQINPDLHLEKLDDRSDW